MKQVEITVKPHFLYLARLMYPYLTLLIIPVARGLFLHLFYGKNTLSGVLVAEGILLVLAGVTSVLKFKRTRIYLSNDKMTVEKGLFLRVNYSVFNDKSMVTVLENNPVLSLFGAVRLKIYTEAGKSKREDENILINRKTAGEIYKIYGSTGQAVKSNTFGEVIMSAALSSVTAGLLLTVPIVKVTMSLLGKNLPSLLPTAKNIYLSTADASVLGRWLTAILLLGYAVSFLVLFLRNYGFLSVKSDEKIMISSGMLPHRTVMLPSQSVKAVRTVTAPLMLLARKCAVKFSACGYGRLKGEIGLLLPSVKPTIAKGLVQWLLPRFKQTEFKLKPERKAYRRIIWLPSFLLSVAVEILGFVKVYIYKLWDFAVLVAVFITVYAIVLLLMRCYSVKHGGVSEVSEQITAYGIKGFSLDKLQLKTEAVQWIRISRTPFDKRHGHCTVKLRATGKNRDTVKVKYLDYHDCVSFFEDLCRQ